MIIIFLLPLILMSSSYYKVMRVLWRSTKNMSALTNTRLSDQSNASEPTFFLSTYEPRPDLRARPYTIRQRSLVSVCQINKVKRFLSFLYLYIRDISNKKHERDLCLQDILETVWRRYVGSIC